MSCLSDRGLCRSANAIHLPFGDQLGCPGAPFPIVILCSLDPFARIIQRPLRGGPGVNAIHFPSGDQAGARYVSSACGLKIWRACERDQSVAIRPSKREAPIAATTLAPCGCRKCEDEQGKGRHKHRSNE